MLFERRIMTNDVSGFFIQARLRLVIESYPQSASKAICFP